MALRDILVLFKVSVDQKELVDADKNVKGLIDTFGDLKKAAELALAGLAVKRLGSFIAEHLEAANMVDVFAKRLDVSTQQVQEFQAIAQTTGLQMNFFQHAFRTLNFQVAQSKPEFGELAAAAGGVKFNFKDTGELFWQVGEALSHVQDKTRRAYLAQTLLGRSAQQLMPIFSGTTEEVEAFRKKIQETAVVYSDEFIAKAKKSYLEIGVLDRMWRKFGGLFVEQLLPAWDRGVTLLQNVAKGLQEWTEKGEATNTVIAGLIVGVGALTVAMALLIASALAAVVPFVGLFLIVEDFVTFMRGGQSVIGLTLDTLFGPGGSENARQGIVDIWGEFKKFFAWFESESERQGFFKTILEYIDLLTKAFDNSIDEWTDRLGSKLRAAVRSAIGDQAADLLGIPRDAPAALKPASGAAPYTPSKALYGGVTEDDQAVIMREFPDEANNGPLIRMRATALHIHNVIEDYMNGISDGFQSVSEGAGRRLDALINPSIPNNTGAGSYNAPVHVENNIVVQGSANSATARDIAKQTGDATVVAVGGRDRAAIGAAVGISP